MTTGAEKSFGTLDRDDGASFNVEDIGSETGISGKIGLIFIRRQEVDRCVLGEKGNVRRLAYFFAECLHDRASGDVFGVDDAAFAVATFLGEMEDVLVHVGDFCEGDTQLHKILNRLWAGLDDESHNGLVAEAGAR